MTMLVTAAGLADDPLAGMVVLPLDVLLSGQDPLEGAFGIDFPNDRDPDAAIPWLGRAALIRVAFPAMGDGRGYSIARRLRAMGYAGRLRAAGPLIADQMDAVLRVGFDEVEISDTRAGDLDGTAWAHRRRSYQQKLGL